MRIVSITGCVKQLHAFALRDSTVRDTDPASTWEKFFLSKAEEDVTGSTFLPELRSFVVTGAFVISQETTVHLE